MSGRRNAPAVRLRCRSALLGAAVGGRASLSVAGPVLTRLLASRSAAGIEPPSRVAVVTSALALGGELIGDKLPLTAGRLAGPGLAVRVGATFLGTLILARRERTGIGTFAVVGALAAAGISAALSAMAGVRWRAATADRGLGLPGAMAEDAIDIGVAVAGSWPRRIRAE
ncbi:hypothetical protein [Glaciibacter superstes]|uniref:hypothetical protein n=1 Tax=Glaciibacter superstes TaxID=501023 RepID=UPI0003B62588|nr:hypothetical protein [Glaciibacter superstes]